MDFDSTVFSNILEETGGGHQQHPLSHMGIIPQKLITKKKITFVQKSTPLKQAAGYIPR